MTTTIHPIENGSVTSPKGYKATGIAAGIKRSGGLDLGILVSQVRCPVAGVYTRNQLKGASLLVTQDHLSDGHGQAVIVNSGNANACTGERGLLDAREVARCVGRHLDISARDVLPSSTGVIGEYLPLAIVRGAIEKAIPLLSEDGGGLMARAMMTTDTVPKNAARRVIVDGHAFTLGGIAKGSGMIHPNMATMLAYLTTDARIESAHLQTFLKQAVDCSFNRITIDGDTSCDDTVLLMANGLSDSTAIVPDSGPLADAFLEALKDLCIELARRMALDGEGVTKIAEITVKGARTRDDATTVARTIAVSPLVKTAMYGCDPNWGRIVNAAGYSGVPFDPAVIDLRIGGIQVVNHGERAVYRENEVHEIMKGTEYEIVLDLHSGDAEDRYITTDLSTAYVDINADYRNRT